MMQSVSQGAKIYRYWILFLLGIIGVGLVCYLCQLKKGLIITGMNNNVSWGFYIAQYTYLVGIAASGVMVVLPCYLHNYRAFSRITVLVEFLAIAAIVMCMLFIFVDIGVPTRILNVIFYPTLHSILFWDMIVLGLYLVFNILIGWNVLSAERKGISCPSWVKLMIYISIPWAFFMRTVTAFVYAGLAGRPYWLTALMAVRFLSSAFCSGPGLLILLCYIVKKVSSFDPGKESIRTLAIIMTYAMILNVFFFLLELFTAFYSQVPGHMKPLIFLFRGLEGHRRLIPWMWAATISAFISLVLLIIPYTREKEETLLIGCSLVIIATWIDKGLGHIIGGFTPDPFGRVTDYWPTKPEVIISIGVYATGTLILTWLYKIVISVKEEVGG